MARAKDINGTQTNTTQCKNTTTTGYVDYGPRLLSQLNELMEFSKV